MQIESFITNCLTALGGQQAIKNIFSIYYQMESQLLENDALLEVNKIDIYRARGGRIRIEKTLKEKHIVTILNGLAGIQRIENLQTPTSVEFRQLTSTDVEQIKRSVRLYPRNFLAHADEHQYHFKGLKDFDTTHAYELELLVENATYYFDPNTFFCLSLVDRHNNLTISYSDYQKNNEIFTPMIEKTKQNNTIQVDRITLLNYNLDLSDELFFIQ